MPRTVRVLTNAGALRRVLTGYLLYGLVEVAIWLAIILWAYAEGGAGLAGFVAVVQLVPAAVLAPPLAGLGDRVSRGTALAAAHLGVAVTTLATTAALLLDAPATVVVVASAAATTALAVVRPLHFAALPQLVRKPDELVSATVLCLRTGLPAPFDRSAHTRAPGWRAAFAGMGTLGRDRAVLVLLLVLTTKFVIEGAHDVLGVSPSVDGLDLGSSGAGIIVGAMGLGGLVGGMVATSVASRDGLAPVLLGSGLVQGVGLAMVAVLLALVPVVALLALAGTGGAVLMVAGRTLLQRTADQRMLARVFAVQEGTALLGLAVGAALAPVLIDRLSPQGAFVPFGLGAALVTSVGFLLVRDLDARAVLRPDEAALLRGVPFLSVLPAYELEQLARSATWVAVDAGADVVVQGEPGDRFYVVGEGALSVTVGDVVRPAPLGPGDAFGEIALLRAVARTASVRATRPCRLLTLGSEDFLAAVTGSPSGRAIAAEVASSHLARDTRRR